MLIDLSSPKIESLTEEQGHSTTSIKCAFGMVPAIGVYDLELQYSLPFNRCSTSQLNPGI